MSTTVGSAHSNPEGTTLSPLFHTLELFKHVVIHVFFPLRLPRDDDRTPENDFTLASAVCAAAHDYSAHVCGTPEENRWSRITRMLDNLRASIQSERLDKDLVVSQLRTLELGDILTLFIRPQNAAIVLTKRENGTLFESFEVSPDKDAVEKTPGSLICSYPWSAVEAPNRMFDDEDFQVELVSFLSLPSALEPSLPPPPGNDPKYVTALLAGILRGVGRPAVIAGIRKRIRDSVGQWPEPEGEWRRSAVWLLVRVAIQISVDRSYVGRTSYKQFILYFICTLARDENNTSLPGDLLHLMSCKILRRLRKLGASASKWLSKIALGTCARLRAMLDDRTEELSIRRSPFQNPIQTELVRDTKLLLLNGDEYIRKTLSTPDFVLSRTPFHPNHRRRGTLQDFLSSNGTFFDEAYDADIIMYDIEQSVERELDDWVAHVVNVDDGCVQLEILMDRYVREYTKRNPEQDSIKILTLFELFVALDKLAVREIPMLTDYSPDVKIMGLEKLCLRKTTSLHRLSRIYQYLVARHSQSRPGWLAPSEEFTVSSFPVRFYDKSPHLHQLKARVEQEAATGASRQVEPGSAGLVDGQQGGFMQPLSQEDGDSELPRSPLPISPLLLKVVVFELDCPPCFRVWRSAIARLRDFLKDGWDIIDERNCRPLVDIPEFRPYLVNRGPLLYSQIDIVYYYPDGSQSRDGPTLRYVVHTGCHWRSSRGINLQFSQYSSNPSVNSTSHTSNDVLAKQADCPADLSLDEFITFGHLRSGPSLQWLNILQALRSKTLNLRRSDVLCLLANAASQVGPLDPKTGTWIWHQELQDESFCNALLGELDDVFVDGEGLVDAVFMSIISLLLARILASSPSIDVSEKAIIALRRVRRKIFGWVQDLSYDLKMAPTNVERTKFLRYMSAACRSTFDADRVTLRKLICSAEDVDALLSCFFFIQALTIGNNSGGSNSNDDDTKRLKLLFDRDSSLTLGLEEIMRDVIFADPSDYGLDLAVARFFTTYHPGPLKLELLQHPNARWLSCNTKATGPGKPSQTVHINLLDGQLRVDGQLFGRFLSQKIEKHPEFKRVIGSDSFFVVPSDLPGMDFMTLTVTSRYRVHFVMQGEKLVIRAQCNRTNQVLELIPSDVLREHLPPVLVDNHIYWLNLATEVVEIRPFTQCWEQSAEHWRIERASESYYAYKGHSSLVNTQSPTWEMLSRCFKCLDGKNILVTTSPNSADPQSEPRLSITLPRYDLSFFVNDKEELESRDFKYMVYDENQYIQTFFGLESLLVLRSMTCIAGLSIPEGMITRLVLIPDGSPESKKGKIGLSFDSSPYHTFKVDPELGCLIGNGSLKSTWLLASLHSATSAHRPDPLTCKLGTQAALDLLRSAGCRSIMQLKALHNNNSWSSTWQYPQISAACNEIQERYYWEEHAIQDDLPGKRAARRAMHLFPFDTAKPTSPEVCSHMEYTIPNSNKLESVVSTAASAACRWSTNTMDRDAISKWVEGWTNSTILSGSPGNRGPRADPDFTRAILLATVHKILETTEEAANQRFRILFLLPLMVYHSSFRQNDLLSKLVALARQVQSRLGDPPQVLRPGHLNLAPFPQCMSEQNTPLQITLEHLLSKREAPNLPLRTMLSQDDLQGVKTPEMSEDADTPALDHLLSSLQAHSAFQQRYITLLQTSAAMHQGFRAIRTFSAENYIDTLRQHYMKCEANYISALSSLKTRLGPTTGDASEQALEQLGHWPPITPDVLLRCLASTSPIDLSKKWKKCLASFAQLLLELQRARRLFRFALDGLEEEFWKELENEQCDGWNPEMYPDWLLIQVQGNFLIRRVQVETAMELMSPRSKGNTVMQVNMGEGKSSIIIPIVAAALADGKQLVRVIVPKALIPQMFDILAASLGGLANRPIYHLPFSRTGYISKSTDDCHPEYLPRLVSQCMAERGVLLLQPEHVVSLKLMSVEKQIRNLFRKPTYNRTKTSTESLTSRLSESDWLGLEKWLHSNVRDILDESDEILHSRFQLIYTIGLEQHIDGYPNRWIITQQVLQLAKEHLCTLSRNQPTSVEQERGLPGSFPRVHVVRDSSIGQHLTSMIVEDVMAGRLPNFKFQHISDAALHDAIRSFISDKNVLQDTAKRVEEHARHSIQSCLWNGLLLIRGLLSSDILLFALTERRWRVDYGLDRRPQSSTKLAVPYRAKDVPAPNTQFGHPDLTIILTCLCYYYAGLTEEQLRTSFEILLDLDDAFEEYKHWIRDCRPIPSSLQTLRNINLKSSEQWDKVTFPLFSRNQAAVNFYLSRVVFPREAKEFPWKLCGSSWDLGERRKKVTTGFSGTTDGRWLLPLSVIQHDLDHQRGTSGGVLACLLRQEQIKDLENYIVTRERRTTHEFLKLVAMQQPEIRVLLDVGAQILDLSNYEVAQAWLCIASNTAGAVYFDENDELMVLPRDGSPRQLSSSPLSQQLGSCVVYLDHPHTRGTDLKFPVGSRAAVTLGQKVTKDSLMQGCMRMRKLGYGHTVMFFAPPGVDQSIRAVTRKREPTAQITIADVLSWTIHETWSEIQYRAPYWAQQGIDHQSRSDAWSRFRSHKLSPARLSRVWCQPNCKSLADLYAPRETEDVHSDLSAVPGMEQRCRDLGVLSTSQRGGLEEEQEREVHREREREREVELPPRAEAATHSLHPDVVAFVKTGIIPPWRSGSVFLPIFATLRRSSAATQDAKVWSSSILATADFSKAIEPGSTKGNVDQYLRHVQWILSSEKYRTLLVILSPFEADLLMPDIRVSQYVHLHVYAPRTSQRMKPSDDLQLYAIPPLPSDWAPPWELIDQLNVFSGQFCFRDYQSYLRLCHFLDHPTQESQNNTGKVRRNATIPWRKVAGATFSSSPLPSVMALLSIRARGRPFDHTHMGKVLKGLELAEEDFKEPKSESVVSGYI